MSPEDWKMVRGGIPIIELNLFDPGMFQINERKVSYWHGVRIGPIAKYLCEGQLWQQNTEKSNFRLELSEENSSFVPKDNIFLHYLLDNGDEPTGNRTVWLYSRKNKNELKRLFFCQDYRNLKETIAGLIYSAMLAFLYAQQPLLVDDIRTYAFPTYECSDELSNKIGTKTVALANTYHPIAIARIRQPKSVLSGSDRILIAAGIHFLEMERTLKGGIQDLENVATSVSREFHPRSNT